MKRFILCLIILCSLSLLVACKEEEKTKEQREEKAISVGVFIYEEDDTYINTVADNLKADLTELGMVSEFKWANSSQSVQDTQIIEMLQKGEVDVLVINLVEPHSVLNIMTRITQYDIPVIFFNREPDLITLESYEDVVYVGSKAEEAGDMQGEMIHSLWNENIYDRNKDGSLQYFMIRGDNNVEATSRTINSVKRAKELNVPLSQVGHTVLCNWERTCAKDAIDYIMLEGKNVPELIISNNDSMALGALDSLQAFGYNTDDASKFIPVIGVDAISEALIALEKGCLYGTVKQDSEKMAQTIAIIANNIVTGKDRLENTGFTWDKSGIGVRIPYQILKLEK